MRWKTAGIVLAIAFVVGGASVGYFSYQTGEMILLVRSRPVADCGSVRTGSRPYRVLSSIPDPQIHQGIVLHILFAKRYEHNRMLWIVGYNLYGLALSLQTTSQERRDLFSRLDCGIRPRVPSFELP